MNSTSKDVSHIFNDRSKVLCCLVLVQHLVEGVVKLAGDRVDLQLLPDDLVLQLVDPERHGILWIEGGTKFVLRDIFFALLHITIDEEVIPVVQLADVHLRILRS